MSTNIIQEPIQSNGTINEEIEDNKKRGREELDDLNGYYNFIKFII